MNKRGPKPSAGAPFYALGKARQLTREQMDFARRRIGGLASFSEAHRPLIDLLANAYLCGLIDGAEASRPEHLPNENPEPAQAAE